MTLRGGVKAFPLETVLQLLAATEKTGVLEVRDGAEGGVLELTRGRLTGARYEDDTGVIALGPIFATEDGDFEFREVEATGEPDLHGDLDGLLEIAAAERDRYRAVRAAIPHDQVRFALSPRAAERGEIRLGSSQWRALLAVDPAHDVSDIAQQLGQSRIGTATMLADLLSAGLIEPVDGSLRAPEDASPHAEQVSMPYARRLPPMRPLLPTVAGEPVQLIATVPEFPLETILQLLATTKKTGRLEVRGPAEGYVLGFDHGRLSSAEWEDESGELALGAAFTLVAGEVLFVPMAVAPAGDLVGDLDDLLDRAVRARDLIAANRALIPNERMRFRLSERAAQQQPQITLTADQWRALLTIDGERDVSMIAQQLRMRRLPTLVLLADLAREGLVDVIEAPEAGKEVRPDDRELTWPFVERRRTPWSAPSEMPAAPATAAEPEAEVAEPAVEVAEPADRPTTLLEPAPGPSAEPPRAEVEEPLEETPLDRGPEQADDRLAALSGVFGPPEPAPPPSAWDPPVASTEAEMADAAARAFAEAAPAAPRDETTPPPFASSEEAIDPRLAAFGGPVVEPASTQAPAAPEPADREIQRRPWDPEPSAPTWEPEPAAPSWPEPATPPWEPASPTSEWTPSGWESGGAPSDAAETERVAEVDPRLAAFDSAPLAEAQPIEPEAATPGWTEHTVETPAPPEPEAAPEPSWPERTYERAESRAAEAFVEPQPAPPQKKKGLFGGLFGGKQAAPPPVARAGLAVTNAGKLALFANALIDGYNSGQYGKGRVEDRMIGLLMRVDEQADPIDRALPVMNDRIDVASVDDGVLPEHQLLPYVATLVRQVYDDAERTFGKDKARRGFREVRDRVFGKDQAALHVPGVAGLMPKV